MKKELEILLRNNRDWADKVTREDPTFFERLSKLQTPEYLWIGCSDSRVPANQIMGLAPGEVFVHAISPMSWCTPISTACPPFNLRWMC